MIIYDKEKLSTTLRHNTRGFVHIYSEVQWRLLNYAQNHAAMLEVCDSYAKLFSRISRLHFEWRIILHATVCKANVSLRHYIVHRCNTVYLQHGGGNDRRQNDVTISPRIGYQ